MFVLVVSCVFSPELVVSGQTSVQIAEELVRRGHEVTVITAFPSRPGGKLYPGYRHRLLERQKSVAGFELVRCFSFPSAESRMFSRFLENISFGLSAGWAMLTEPRADVVYSNVWPFFAEGIVSAIAHLRGIPIVLSRQDIYPESLIAQQRIQSDSWMARWMFWLDGVISRAASALIVISDRFADTYRNNRAVIADRVHIVPNWTDAASVAIDYEWRRFRHEHNIPGDGFLLVYGGNIGVAAGVETLIESFHYLKDVQGLHILVAGEGSRLNACQTLVHTIGMDRVTFYTPWPKQDTSRVLGAADLLVLPTHGQQSLASVPSKLIAYMLAARPVIALALPDSDLAKTIEQSGCGWVVLPDQPKELADKIREVVRLPALELAQRGQAGREYALKNFTGEVCLPKVIRVLEQAAA